MNLHATPVGLASSLPLPTTLNRLPTSVGGSGTSSFHVSFADLRQGRLRTGGDDCEAVKLLASTSLEKPRLKAHQRPGVAFTFRGGNHMEQQEIGLVGSVTRPMHRHSVAEIKACRKKGHACRLAVMHSGDDQERIAERIGVSAGYFSMLLSGKRRLNSDLQEKLERVTGSWAPFQWDALRRGIDLHFDSVNVARATGEYIVERAKAA